MGGPFLDTVPRCSTPQHRLTILVASSILAGSPWDHILKHTILQCLCSPHLLVIPSHQGLMLVGTQDMADIIQAMDPLAMVSFILNNISPLDRCSPIKPQPHTTAEADRPFFPWDISSNQWEFLSSKGTVST